MYKMQQVLLTLLVCLYSTTLLAQTQASIRITGINKLLEDNVRLFLSIEQQKDHTMMSEGRLRRLDKKAPQEISAALQPYGYYRPVIKSKLIQIAPDHWQANYTIDPGPPLPVTLFDFTVSGEMSADPDIDLLRKSIRLRQGDTFNHPEYDDIKTRLARLAIEHGYFNARFTEHRVEIDLNAYQARIHLHYDSGPRYRFGETSLQQDALYPQFLRRFIPYQRGSFYTLNEMIDLQQALNDSDYFRTVEVSLGKPEADNHEIPITAVLTPRKRHRYSFGLGYGTDTGARTRLGWDIPLLNRRGHRINSEARVSEVGYSVSTQYRVPVFNPRTDQIIYKTGIVNEKTTTSDSTLRTIGVSLSHNRDLWHEVVSMDYQHEEYVIANDRGDTFLLMPGIKWSRTWGRNFIHALDGVRFDIGLRGASKQLISDADFFQFQGGIKAIRPLGHRNRLITRGSLGGTWTEAFHQLPSSVRFFAGGAQSVRGFGYQSLGPTDASGQVIGGKNLMTGSIEFEHGFNDNWGAAIFYDAGNAIDNFSDKLERGAGFGFRWQSPVGPIRIDLASAVSDASRPWRLHITIGPDL
jgi:translocation and assembly module TamA